MSLYVEVFTPNDIIYWQTAFQVLGIKRSEPILRHSGLPPEVLSSTGDLASAALHFWNSLWQGIRWKDRSVDPKYSGLSVSEGDELALRSLLKDVFELLEGAYGSSQAHEIYAWSVRNFVNQDQVNLWFAWSLVLSSFEEQVPESDSNDSSLPAELVGIIDANFGPAAKQLVDELVNESEKIPISPIERKMIALEVTSPTDFVEVDLSDIFQLLLARQRAYETWRMIDTHFEESDRQVLLWWAYAKASEIGMPLEDIQLPTR